MNLGKKTKTKQQIWMLGNIHKIDREERWAMAIANIEALAVTMRRWRLQWYGLVCRKEREEDIRAWFDTV